MTPRIGDFVIYISSKGQPKPAMVLTTSESYKAPEFVANPDSDFPLPDEESDDSESGEYATSLPALAAGELHLGVFGPRGYYFRPNVKSREAAIAVAEADPENHQSGDFTNVWVPREAE